MHTFKVRTSVACVSPGPGGSYWTGGGGGRGSGAAYGKKRGASRVDALWPTHGGGVQSHCVPLSAMPQLGSTKSGMPLQCMPLVGHDAASAAKECMARRKGCLVADCRTLVAVAECGASGQLQEQGQTTHRFSKRTT